MRPESTLPTIQISACALALAIMLAFGAVSPAQAQTFTVLHSFTGGTDGGNPAGGVIRDAAGNLYGTALYGGALGFGTAFKITP